MGAEQTWRGSIIFFHHPLASGAEKIPKNKFKTDCLELVLLREPITQYASHHDAYHWRLLG
jgi:hypothetical protein